MFFMQLTYIVLYDVYNKSFVFQIKNMTCLLQYLKSKMADKDLLSDSDDSDKEDDSGSDTSDNEGDSESDTSDSDDKGDKDDEGDTSDSSDSEDKDNKSKSEDKDDKSESDDDEFLTLKKDAVPAKVSLICTFTSN